MNVYDVEKATAYPSRNREGTNVTYNPLGGES